MDRGLRVLLKTAIIAALVMSVGIVVGADNAQTTAAGSSETADDLYELDIIVLDKEGYSKDRKEPVRFRHKKHARDYKILCWECHHDYDGKNNVWSPWGTIEKCDDCHDPTEKDGDIMKLQTAFHINCKKCHEERAIFGKDPKAYRRCTTCHIKDE
ncbi:MAG: cytochrome c3 family protein [Deltaproteobacteria bacterium]|nr:cytochrome c3 family protein [Deltaproteobacteria bacterium]